MCIWVTAAVLLVFGVFGASGAASATPVPSSKHTSDEQLNVVVILSDDERYDGTPVMKNVQTLLASHGVTFTDMHVTTSLCAPSRASILTGQYAHHTGVVQNFDKHVFAEQGSDLASLDAQGRL